MVSGVCPHSHVGSPLKYFHLFRCSLLHVTPVRTRLRHLHAVHELICPFARLSSWLTAQLCNVKFFRRCHLLQRMTFTGKSAVRTEPRKHSLFKRLYWNLAVERVGSVYFLFLRFHSSTYMSSDVRWCGHRKPV